MIKLQSNSELDTIEIAKNIAGKLNKNDVIILSGDLGAGKTKFVQGILTYFDLENKISSPTFTIVNEYNTANGKIYHFDLYRLEDTDEFLSIGGDEYFDSGMCIIEWGEKIEEVLPKDYIKIEFIKDDNNENLRTLKIDCIGNAKLDI